ncbi:major facilitator superfamily domain-containing protein [Dactylonectria macrodidyma]|uniref:Probable transporter MCH1 n=1 Tax=Dactylonectria macrodidyma TaxID=307937 RepID=A0A9P9EPS7_9HYPO|nr:major facilitator superfamily domain-containing protein [Dactylonectria macrodidyma]
MYHVGERLQNKYLKEDDSGVRTDLGQGTRTNGCIWSGKSTCDYLSVMAPPDWRGPLCLIREYLGHQTPGSLRSPQHLNKPMIPSYLERMRICINFHLTGVAAREARPSYVLHLCSSSHHLGPEADLPRLTGGSANIFGLYGPRLIRDLSFTQNDVSTVSTVLLASVYCMIPVFGRVCQLASPRFLSFLAAALFGIGYLSLERLFCTTIDDRGSAHSISFAFGTSICAFACIGSATSAIIIASMTACARTFERSPQKGLFMSLPVASLGISGMLHSFIAVTFFSTPSTIDHNGREISIICLFRFLATLLLITGFLAGLGLCTPETKMLSTSASLEQSIRAGRQADYGTTGRLSDIEATGTGIVVETRKNKAHSMTSLLGDPALCYLALANLFLQGACEVYNMNLSSIFQSNMGGTDLTRSLDSAVAEHVSVLAIASTFARLSGGFVFDRFPSPESCTGSPARSFNLSSVFRSPIMIFLIMGIFGVCGFILLSVVPAGANMSLLMTTTLIGVAYGASSSLAPLATFIWSPQQFPVAYGIINMTPAIGIGLYNILYSSWYEQGIYPNNSHLGSCFGWQCYGKWAESGLLGAVVSLAFVLLAWCVFVRRSVNT